MVEKLITLGKRGDLARTPSSGCCAIESKTQYVTEIVRQFSAPAMRSVRAAMCAFIKAGFRYGDMAPMAIIEFVDRDVDAKGAADKARVAAEEAAD